MRLLLQEPTREHGIGMRVTGCIIGILAIERLSWLWTGDYLISISIVALSLPLSGMGQSTAKASADNENSTEKIVIKNRFIFLPMKNLLLKIANPT